MRAQNASRWMPVAIVAVVLSSALPGTAQASTRVALVIGNAAYEHTAPLTNPGNDAADMAAVLGRLGFEVVLGTDLDLDGFDHKLDEFKEAARDADTTLFFYAGHGLQVAGKNWLVPTDAALERRRDLKRKAIELDDVLGSMSGTNKLVFLDACRNNPLAGDMAQSMGQKRSTVATRGLARVNVPEKGGVLIGYATAAGEVADDGTGRNSPYTAALLEHIATPGLSVDDMLTKVADTVRTASRKRGDGDKVQIPWKEGSMTKIFYFNPTEVPPPPPPPPGGAAKEAYEAAVKIDKVDAFRVVVEDFPGTTYAKLAQVRIDKLEDAPLVVAGGDPDDAGAVPPPPPTAEGVEAGLGLNFEARRLVQMGLASAGHDPGPADGAIGKGTREALRGWQRGKGFEETGYLTREQSEALMALGREESARRAQAAAAERERKEREAEARRQADAERRERERQQAESERKAREEAERRRLALEPGRTFRDCPECPEMVVVPAGSFRMGSPESEAGRNGDEGPVHEVTIGRPFAVGVYEVTRGEFGRFVSETGRSMGNACYAYEAGGWEERTGRHWRNPGFSQTDAHPAVCVNWDDAQAYVRWLSGKTGEEYRLLSESEWEYVARAGTTTARHWGEGESGQCRYANGADASTDFDWRTGCNDGYARTAPVGSFAANGFGLRDVMGNVWEWVEDCWNDSYHGAPGDGSAWTSGNCGGRVLRGGSWSGGPRYLRSAYRHGLTTGRRIDDAGFRLARTLTP